MAISWSTVTLPAAIPFFFLFISSLDKSKQYHRRTQEKKSSIRVSSLEIRFILLFLDEKTERKNKV